MQKTKKHRISDAFNFLSVFAVVVATAMVTAFVVFTMVMVVMITFEIRVKGQFAFQI